MVGFEMDPFQDRSVSGPVSGSQQESPPGVCRTGFPYASLSRSFGGRTAIGCHDRRPRLIFAEIHAFVNEAISPGSAIVPKRRRALAIALSRRSLPARHRPIFPSSNKMAPALGAKLGAFRTGRPMAARRTRQRGMRSVRPNNQDDRRREMNRLAYLVQ